MLNNTNGFITNTLGFCMVIFGYTITLNEILIIIGLSIQAFGITNQVITSIHNRKLLKNNYYIKQQNALKQNENNSTNQ